MVNITSSILISSLLLIQGIGGTAGLGGKAGVGGSAPVPAPVLAHVCNAVTGSATHVSCAITVAAGEFIAVYSNADVATAPTSITDSLGTLTAASASQPYTWFTGGAHGVVMYCEANATAGTHTIQINYSSTLIAMAIESFSGASTAACVTGGGGSIETVPAANAISSGTNPFSCNAITTTQTNDVIFAGASQGTITTPTAGVGYTVQNNITAALTAQEDGPAALVGSVTPTFATSSTGKQNVCYAMAIKHV